MPTIKLLVLIPFAALASACASAPVSGADAVSRLQQQQRANPGSAGVSRALGIAQYQANNYPAARTALETAARLDPRDGTTALYLGLTAEAQHDLPAAKAAYSSYLSFGRTSRIRSQLQARLAALARKELEADARLAIAQEATVSGQVGSPLTIAVLPLRFTGSDSALRPLERGFADLLTTDLSRSAQLTLVERSRLQALLDEMALTGTGAVDAGTSARAGRLLRAGRVVQGSLLQVPHVVGGVILRADAAVVDVPTSRVQGAANGSDALEQVFDIEKRLALDLLRELGVTLTVAERNAIEQRPTRSLTAFLAYSRGLAAEDAGRYDDASRFFNDAARIDPGFGAALQKGQEASRISAGATSAGVEASIKGSSEEKVAVAASTGQSSATTSGSSGGGGGASSLAKEVAANVNTSQASGATQGATTTATAGTTDPNKKTGTFGDATGTTNTGTAGLVSFRIPRVTP